MSALLGLVIYILLLRDTFALKIPVFPSSAAVSPTRPIIFCTSGAAHLKYRDCYPLLPHFPSGRGGPSVFSHFSSDWQYKLPQDYGNGVCKFSFELGNGIKEAIGDWKDWQGRNGLWTSYARTCSSKVGGMLHQGVIFWGENHGIETHVMLVSHGGSMAANLTVPMEAAQGVSLLAAAEECENTC